MDLFVLRGFLFFNVSLPGTRPGRADEATGKIERSPGGGCVCARKLRAKRDLAARTYGWYSVETRRFVDRCTPGATRSHGAIEAS